MLSRQLPPIQHIYFHLIDQQLKEKMRTIYGDTDDDHDGFIGELVPQ